MSVANNECEGSQEHTLTLAPSGVDRWFATLSTNYFGVNTYIIALNLVAKL